MDSTAPDDGVESNERGFVSDFVEKYLVPEYHPSHEEAFEEYCGEIGRAFYVLVSHFVLWGVLLTWPVDYYIYGGGELFYHINVWRVSTTSVALIMLAGHHLLGLTRNHWAKIMLLAGLTITFSIYYSLSHVGGLTQPWFYSTYCLPFLSAAFINFRLFERLIVSIGLPSVALLSYFGSNPQHLTYPYLGTPLMLIVAFVVVSTLVGQIFHNLFKRSFIQSRLLENSLNEKQALVEEVHHRVKNNLQTISSMFKLQLNRAESEESRDVLRSSVDRLRSMASIHEFLYENDDLSDIDFQQYVEELCNHQKTIHGRDEVKLILDIDDLEVDLDPAINCGLLINELVSNAFEHGFNDNEPGRIEVDLRVLDDGMVELRVSDDGKGMDNVENIEEGPSTGMSIVRTLVEHGLEGNLEIDGKDGFTVRASFEL